MYTDFVINGRGHGEVGQMLAGCRFDPGLLRPFIHKGIPHVTINSGQMVRDNQTGKDVPKMVTLPVRTLQERGVNSPVFNAATLRKEEWIALDQVVLRAARFRLSAWADLAMANSYGGFNGMSKMILEYEQMSDPGEAIVDMDGITPGRSDGPIFQLQGLPLPITHSDFSTSARVLAISRNTNTPFDTTMGEAAGRRVAESIEKTLIGNVSGVLYGGQSTYSGGYSQPSQVYGYCNYPDRITQTTWYLPTGLGRSGTGWTPLDTLKDLLSARNALYASKFYGPFMVYTSNDWDQYLDSDYILTGGNVATQTLRDRMRAVQGIIDVRRLDMMFASQLTGPGSDVNTLLPFTMVLVQMTPDVARAVNGMDITTVQWESKGGMQLNFKVMCIQVPQLRSDYYGNCGILQATATR